jgi:ABC-type sugar transport system, permease component
MRSVELSLGYRGQRRLAHAAVFVLLLVLSAISIVPVLIVAFTAFKTDAEISLMGFKWLPSSLYLGNFAQALEMGNWARYFFNSALVTLVTVVGSLFFNSLAGFTFARLKFRGRDLLFVLLLIGMMIPPYSTIIPQFIIMRSWPLAGGNDWLGRGGSGLLDTYWSLILPFLSGSFGIFLCKQFYEGFPQSLDDAAKIDSCGPVRMFFVVYVPLSKPILATLTILKSVSTWNDFFHPLIMTQSDKMKTVQLALQMFRGSTSTHYNWLMAATLAVILPMLIVFLAAQKYFVQGIVSSGMKN